MPINPITGRRYRIYRVSVNRPAICSWSRPEPSRLTSMSWVTEGLPLSFEKLINWRIRSGRIAIVVVENDARRLRSVTSARAGHRRVHPFEQGGRIFERLLVTPETPTARGRA